MSLAEIVKSGDLQASLEAIRDRLAEELEREFDSGYCSRCKRSGSTVPALAKQLADVLRALKSMPAGTEKSTVDELAAERERRRAKTSADPTAGVQLGPRSS